MAADQVKYELVNATVIVTVELVFAPAERDLHSYERIPVLSLR